MNQRSLEATDKAISRCSSKSLIAGPHYEDSTQRLDSRWRAAEEIFKFSLQRLDQQTAYLVPCPGEHRHTNRSGVRDCRLMLDGVPTVYCVHTSCAEVIAEANRILRSAIAKAERGGAVEKWTPSPEELKAQRQREQEKQRKAQLQRRATEGLRSILARHQNTERQFRMTSPYSLDCLPQNDWRLHLQLFAPDAVIWIGNTKDSAADDKPEWQKSIAATHFRTRDEWLKLEKCPGNFTCPSVFKNSVHSRSNENAIGRPFLVVESDPNPEKKTGLNRDETRALFQWLRSFLHLRAVVDTGGKSLHGWFEYPDAAALAELKVILPALGCDPALFKASQPCRLPGAWREEKQGWQKLIWLDLNGGRQ